MKKIFKSRIFYFVLGLIIATTVGVSASILYQASEIGFTPKNKNWKVNNLESALNDLYENKGSSATKFCTFVESEYGDSSNHLSIGSKYSCDPGDGTNRNFYILANNGNTIDLIMDKNLTNDTLTWANAMKYFDTDSNGISIKNSWTNVLSIDLPKVQALADIYPNNSWYAVNDTLTWICFGTHAKDRSNQPYCNKSTNEVYAWLYNYIYNCTASGCTDSGDAVATGYWTRDFAHGTGHAWYVYQDGLLSRNQATNEANGIRPVITVLKDNLQG